MGRDPLVNRKAGAGGDIIINNKGTVNIDRLRAMDQDQLLEIVSSGEIPQGV